MVVNKQPTKNKTKMQIWFDSMPRARTVHSFSERPSSSERTQSSPRVAQPHRPKNRKIWETLAEACGMHMS
jgi:hypothetical protein